MQKRYFLCTLALACLTLTGVTQALAQESFKVGMVLPLTEPFAATGRQNGATVALGLVAAHHDGKQEFETFMDVKHPGKVG